MMMSLIIVGRETCSW